MQTKSALRQHFREQRRSISSAYRQQAAEQFLSLVLRYDLLKYHQTIAAYFPRDGELNILPLIDYCWKQDRHICLPSISQEQLIFKRYQEKTQMKRGADGILEPGIDEVLQPDLVFLPLVAFDRLGNRLGMGKGFYDKTFQHARPILIGVAYACQEAQRLPVDTWDVPLNGIVTEEECMFI